MRPTKHFAALIASLAATAILGASATPPPELAALVAKAQIKEAPSIWCRGDFLPRTPNTFAVAVPRPNGGGRYVVLGLAETPIELATFSGGADLTCYSVDEAKKLSASIAQSETIHGGISPTLDSTVVCGFVDDTSAVCWQYSPAERAFVKVGGWVT
jgi:hypothetical protein